VPDPAGDEGVVSGMADLVVTGATGRLGSRVARRLDAAAAEIAVVCRDPLRLPSLSRAQIKIADYSNRPALRHAFTGARTVFMVSASESTDRVDIHRGVVDIAVECEVRHLVYTSFDSAAPDATFTLARDHWATEQHIVASGLAYTFLRDNLYADFLPLMAGGDGVIRGPAGEGRVAAVAQDDIADAAVAVLTDPAAHAGATYRLTGPESLTLAEAAETISSVTGREVRYDAETVDEAYRSRASYGAPDWQVEAWVSTYTSIAAGDLAEVTDDVPRLAGHAPTSLEDLLRRSG
jgi:uncharacterized protein YbjT (DUF2867 family)